MQNNNRCLLCCDSQEEWMILKNICNAGYMIATSDYKFFKNIREQEDRVVFLESNESNPYEAIWEILDQIHAIVDEEIEDRFFRLFHLPYHVEGGFPTKIAQMIINLNLISAIVKDNDICEIYIFDNVHNWIMNESIFLYSRSRGITCHILAPNSKEEKTSLKTLNQLKGIKENLYNEELFQKEKGKVGALINTSAGKGIKETTKEKEDVGILYCPDFLYRKHVDWVLRRIDAIGHDTTVICFYDTEAVSEFRQKGLKTDCLEDYFEESDFISAYDDLNKKRVAVLQRLADQLKVSYQGTDLSKWLLLKLRNQYFRELLTYLYMDVCAGNYFKQRKFAFIHVWGTESWQTWICYDNTRDVNSKLFKIEFAGFISYKWKMSFPDMLSAMFTMDDKERFSQTFVNDYRGKVVPICDPNWSGRSAVVEHSRSDRKKRIGILPTGILKGFTTYRFYYATWMPLIDRLLDLGYEIVFKNHPALRDCWEEDVEARYQDNEQVTILASGERIDKALALCDMVITDISSAAYDAAMAQKAVFCIVDRQGYEMIQQHSRGFSIYQCVAELVKDIENVAKNGEIYERVLDRQNTYMAEITGDKDNDRIEFVYTVLQGLE